MRGTLGGAAGARADRCKPLQCCEHRDLQQPRRVARAHTPHEIRDASPSTGGWRQENASPAAGGKRTLSRRMEGGAASPATGPASGPVAGRRIQYRTRPDTSRRNGRRPPASPRPTPPPSSRAGRDRAPRWPALWRRAPPGARHGRAEERGALGVVCAPAARRPSCSVVLFSSSAASAAASPFVGGQGGEGKNGGSSPALETEESLRCGRGGPQPCPVTRQTVRAHPWRATAPQVTATMWPAARFPSFDSPSKIPTGIADTPSPAHPYDTQTPPPPAGPEL